jgi:hypothetical protein
MPCRRATKRSAVNGERQTNAAKSRFDPPPDRGRDRLDVRQCEDFLVHEARLLDEARFDEWLALFTEDTRCRVPSEPDQASPMALFR